MGSALVRVGTGLPGPGRPSIRTSEIEDEIIERLSNGEFMVSICDTEGMPSVPTVNRWEIADPEFSNRVARARKLGSRCMIERGALVAITPADGRTMTYRSDGSIEMRKEDAVASRKLAAWGYFEAAKKINPAEYGDRLPLGGGEGGNTTIINGNVNNVTLENTPQEAAEIYAEKIKSIG